MMQFFIGGFSGNVVAKYKEINSSSTPNLLKFEIEIIIVQVNNQSTLCFVIYWDLSLVNSGKKFYEFQTTS